MIERFQGKDGLPALLNALRAQFLVDGNTAIAEMIASAAQIKEYSPDAVLFTEGERGGDLFFILAGQVSVYMHGKEVATCSAGMHVGEIGLLEPFKGRSATVVARDTIVIAQVSAQKFAIISEHHPDLWRRMAIELARRLRRDPKNSSA